MTNKKLYICAVIVMLSIFLTGCGGRPTIEGQPVPNLSAAGYLIEYQKVLMMLQHNPDLYTGEFERVYVEPWIPAVNTNAHFYSGIVRYIVGREMLSPGRQSFKYRLRVMRESAGTRFTAAQGRHMLDVMYMLENDLISAEQGFLAIDQIHNEFGTRMRSVRVPSWQPH